MAILKIGGVVMPTPTTYKVSQKDLDSENSKRSETGVMRRTRVRAGIFKISVGWDKLTRAQYCTITNAASAASFSVVFYDPNTNTYLNANMYAGDRDGELLGSTYRDDRPDDSHWKLSLVLTEM